MANDTFKQYTEQVEKTVVEPARNLAAAFTDHLEKVASLQVEATKAYTEVAFSNARAALDIRDTKGLQDYVAKQSEVAKQFGERVKADAEKLTAANQAFAETTQKVTQDSVASVQKATEEGVQKVQKAATGASK